MTFRRVTKRQVNRVLDRQRHAQRVLPPHVVTLPSPTLGLNGREALDDMKPEFAVVLDNWVPGDGKITVRKGSVLWGTLGTTPEDDFEVVAGEVETLIGVDIPSGKFLLAAAGGDIYDASDGDEMDEDHRLATSLTNARWAHAVMNGQVALVNGADAPKVFNGSTVAGLSISAEGLTTTTLNGVNVFKSRSYFWASGTSSFWYSAVNTLGGTVVEFPLGSVGKKGGTLVRMMSWTLDGGAGVDDLAVFFMSSGEVIVYQGSDPGEASDWALVGVFEIAAPLGPRAMTKLGGDIVVATVDGVQSLTRALPGVRGTRNNRLNDNLGKHLRDAIKQGSDTFGWELTHLPRQGWLVLNYPTTGEHEQFVMVLSTGAWWRCRGLGARCWTVYLDRPFFGDDDGAIVEAFTGVNDRGTRIDARARQAFSKLRGPTSNRHVQMVRPLIELNGQHDVTIALLADYASSEDATVTVNLGSGTVATSLWDTALWDESFWSGPPRPSQQWVPVSARGYAISPEIRVQALLDEVAWSGTVVQYTIEGIL